MKTKKHAMLIDTGLIEFLKGNFRLDWCGIHGVSHWERVRANGSELAEQTGADLAVVQLFAYLHDSERENDGSDRVHGPRAAVLARQLNGRFFNLDLAQLTLLADACHGHTHGGTVADITVMTCWDADRLDLGRIGVKPNPRYLCTPAAKDLEFLEQAYRKSRV